jgi:hypothetical protein
MSESRARDGQPRSADYRDGHQQDAGARRRGHRPRGVPAAARGCRRGICQPRAQAASMDLGPPRAQCRPPPDLAALIVVFFENVKSNLI